MNIEILRACCPNVPRARLETFVGPLASTFEEFEINTAQRQAHFLAQVAHESGGFRYLRELATGEAYEGRSDLGNTHAGDGRRFKGRGLIQITGRKNYGLCGQALELPLVDEPELLEHLANACRSAGWFWRQGAGLNLSRRAKAHGIPLGCDLNTYADADDVQSITLAVNGGLNGMADREAYLARAETALA